MKTLSTIHALAIDTAQKVMNQLGITIADVDLTGPGEGLLWLQTYPEVCAGLGIKTHDSTDLYRSNDNFYESEGRLFDLVVFAINDPSGSEPCHEFWIHFIYLENDQVRLEVGVCSVSSQYCGQMMKEITGFEIEQVINHQEANRLVGNLFKKLRRKRNCFKKFL